MSRPGVYAIQHLESGRTYIGSSSDMGRRWREHVALLRRGEHHASDLQVDWNADGESAFIVTVLERIEDQASRILCEQSQIDRLHHPYNANGRAGSGPKAGYTHRPDSIERMRQAKLGKRNSAKHCAAISASKLGKKHLPEHNAAISAGLRGQKRSTETRLKMSASRRKVVVTWGAAISASKKGKPNPRQSAAMKGKPWSVARRRSFELSRLESEV